MKNGVKEVLSLFFAAVIVVAAFLLLTYLLCWSFNITWMPQYALGVWLVMFLIRLSLTGVK